MIFLENKCTYSERDNYKYHFLIVKATGFYKHGSDLISFFMILAEKSDFSYQMCNGGDKNVKGFLKNIFTVLNKLYGDTMKIPYSFPR